MTDKKNPETFDQILDRRLTRRAALKGLAGTTAVVAGGGTLAGLGGCSSGNEQSVSPALGFKELPHGYDAEHHVADGYLAEVLVRWGDPVLKGAPNNFKGGVKDASSQLQQFGYNNDFIGFMPLPFGSDNSDHGLLCVNHEYCSSHMMFPDVAAWDRNRKAVREQVDIEMAAHGHCVLEIKKEDGRWKTVPGSDFNRRITAHTEMEITGPAAGHPRLQTSADPSGRKVYGTLSNCAGGVTPWGTVLIAEENFQDYFGGDVSLAIKKAADEEGNYRSYGGGVAWFTWRELHDRFDIEKEPREFNRFGWMVEFDPYDPTSTPKKRTALGRFCHEGATIVAEHGKPVVAYSGDDGKHQCIYRFISKGSYNKHDRAANMELLAEGDLYVARFHDSGVGEWLKITGDDLASSLIDARLSAAKLGATPMDRPEDIETNPVTGRTYAMLTNNSGRKSDEVDAANPRTENHWGHIIEILPPGIDGDRDHLATHFQWDMFLLAGNPNHPDTAKRGNYHNALSESGWFSNPDNVAFDPMGRMWVSTDGLPSYMTAEGVSKPIHDGIWACETTGDNRALTKHFFGCPAGAEACGPCFTPDGETLFVAVQHPGEASGYDYSKPATRWPDFDPNNPPRPSVVVITKKGGGPIGS